MPFAHHVKPRDFNDKVLSCEDGLAVGNPDASLSFAKPGNGVAVRRACDDPVGWLDSGDRRRGWIGGASGWHTSHSSSGGRDHSGYR